MAENRTINLIHAQDSSGPLASWIPIVVRLQYISVATLIALAAAVGGLYAYVQSRQRAAVETKNTLTETVTADAAKKSLLAAVKDRARVVDAIFSHQKNMTAYLGKVSALFPAGALESISFEESGRSVAAVKVGALGDVLAMVSALRAGVDDTSVRDPQLVSFTTTKDGGFEVTFSFFVLL